MRAKKSNNILLDDAIVENIEEIEKQKEIKLLNLIAEIIVNATLSELYETSDQIPEV